MIRGRRIFSGVSGSGGGGGANITVVNTYADLPAASSVTGEFYFVKTTTGSGAGVKPAGLYYSDGTSWYYDDSNTDIVVVANYSALPPANTVTGSFYWCENSQGTAWLPGPLGGTYYPSGLYYSNGVSWEYMATPYQATQSEVDAGTITDKFVSPATFANASKWSTVGGLKSGTATASVTDVYTTTITGVTSYTTNDAYVIKFNTANSNGATLNINSLGAIQLVKNNDVILTGGDISVGQEFIVIYDGTNFQTIGVAPNQMFAYVTNADSVTINKGQPVYAFGASGDRMSVKLANNTSEATSSRTVGLVFSSSIAAGATGFVITQGVLSNVNTAAYSPGDVLYVGNTAGSLTNVLPYAPNHYTRIGIVERANAGNGLIYVLVFNGFQLDELSDVNITTVPPVSGDVLRYDGSLWRADPQTKLNSAVNLFNYYNFM